MDRSLIFRLQVLAHRLAILAGAGLSMDPPTKWQVVPGPQVTFGFASYATHPPRSQYQPSERSTRA